MREGAWKDEPPDHPPLFLVSAYAVLVAVLAPALLPSRKAFAYAVPYDGLFGVSAGSGAEGGPEGESAGERVRAVAAGDRGPGRGGDREGPKSAHPASAPPSADYRSTKGGPEAPPCLASFWCALDDLPVSEALGVVLTLLLNPAHEVVPALRARLRAAAPLVGAAVPGPPEPVAARLAGLGAEPGDPVYEALTRRGLHLPEHSTRIGSSIASDNHYDQVAFFPGETQEEFTGASGVFDFDGVVFRTLWEERSADEFFAYVRYYVSDHRPLWAEFRI